MNTFFRLLAHTVELIAVISAIQLTVLAFRNPFRPAWLRKAGADNIAAMAITAGISFTTCLEIVSLVAAGFNASIAIAVTMALIFGIAGFNWRVFRCSERLRRADAGQSPFGPLPGVQRPQRAPVASG